MNSYSRCSMLLLSFMLFLWCLQWTGLNIQRDGDGAAAAPRSLDMT